jgi:hypothetical protein
MNLKSLLPLAIAALATPAFAQAPAAYESGVLLKSAELLPAELLRGPTFRVREQVATDGFMAHFEIDTDFGTFTAIGVPQAKRRIAECEAIRKLVETSKGDLFAEGLKRSVEQPIAAVKNIVKDPVGSVKQAPKTVGHFFGKVGSAIGRGAEKVADRVSSGGEPSAGEVGASIGNTAKNAAGFDKAKLDTAKQLGVDPYSDNPRLQEEMDKVTWLLLLGICFWREAPETAVGADRRAGKRGLRALRPGRVPVHAPAPHGRQVRRIKRDETRLPGRLHVPERRIRERRSLERGSQVDGRGGRSPLRQVPETAPDQGPPAMIMSLIRLTRILDPSSKKSTNARLSSYTGQ